MYSIKELSKKRREVKDLEVLVNGKSKLMSFEQIERKAVAVEKKRSQLLREARKVLTFDQMVQYQEGINKFGDIKLSKLPSFEIANEGK
jgi:hypothetical protein